MATYRTSDLEKALKKKGFKKDNTHHVYYWYYYKGKKSSIRTRVSKGEPVFYDNLFSQRKRQIKLESAKDFRN